MQNSETNSAYSANQQTLPGIRDWREPQIVSAQRLASMITEANAAGFDAVRMECWRNPFGYRVIFQRMPDASESQGARAVESMALSSSNHKHPVNTGDCEEKLSSKLLPPHPSNGNPTLPTIPMTQTKTLLA